MRTAILLLPIAAFLMLPHVAKAAPPQYAKVCDTYGANYFYSPGSDTCVNSITGVTKREMFYGTQTGSIETNQVTSQGLADATRAAGYAYRSAGGAMVAAAMPTAMVNSGDRYALAASFSSFAGYRAVGLGATFSLPESGFALTFGVGESLEDGILGSRFGLNFNL